MNQVVRVQLDDLSLFVLIVVETAKSCLPIAISCYRFLCFQESQWQNAYAHIFLWDDSSYAAS